MLASSASLANMSSATLPHMSSSPGGVVTSYGGTIPPSVTISSNTWSSVDSSSNLWTAVAPSFSSANPATSPLLSGRHMVATAAASTSSGMSATWSATNLSAALAQAHSSQGGGTAAGNTAGETSKDNPPLSIWDPKKSFLV